MPKLKTIAILALAACAAAPASAQARRTLRPQTPRRASSAEDAAKNAVATAAAVDAEAEKAKPSDLNFSEAPLAMVLDVYSQLVDRTVLKDPATPDATITVQSRPGQKLSKEEQIEAIEVVLEMNGIHMEDYGEKFVRALPRDKVRQEGIPLIVDEDAELQESGRVVSMMIPFKNIPIDEAKTVLEGLKSQRGLLLVYERIGKILVTDTMQNIIRMRQVAREIDVATPVNENVYVRQIKNANATDIKTALEQIVQESQKQLEKASDAAKNGQVAERPKPLASTPNGTLLRRPGANRENAAPAAPANVESLVTSVSDADRGMIRGKVVIVPDERSNKLIFVTSKTNMDFFDKVIESLDVETTPDTVVKVYRLKYAEAEDVSDMINDLIGNTQKSSSRENQNAAAKSGSGGNLTRGGASQSQPRAQQNAGRQSGEAKAGELTRDNTQVLADKRINGIVVMTQKELVPTLESIIESMDIKLSQVLIETAIIEISLGDDLKTGIDWVQRGRQSVWQQKYDSVGRPLHYAVDTVSGRIVGSGPVGATVTYTDTDGTEGSATITEDNPAVMVKNLVRDTFVNNGSYGLGGGSGNGSDMLNTMLNVGTNATSAFFGGATPLGSGINYLLKSDRLNLAAVIQASKTDSRAKYIASPVIMTVDNKEAVVEATESRKFYSGSTTTSSSTYPTTSYNYTDKDIGITIKLTPKINPNGTVMLKVEEEYSQLGAGQTVLVSGSQGDTKQEPIDTAVQRKMQADVLLDNRQTVVLGGLTEKYVSESETGIPILKDIPWIGKWLFGSVTQSENRKELLVFLTPYVLDDADSAQAEALRRKNSLSDSRPWDNNGWSDSELADPIARKELLRRFKDEAKKQDEERQNRLAIEKWKLDRAKELEKMSDSERKFWLDQHKDELESRADRKEFEKETEGLSQDDLRQLVSDIRKRKIEAADRGISEAQAAEKEKAAEQTLPGDAPAPEPSEPAPAAEEPPAPETAPAPGSSDAQSLLSVLAAPTAAQ